MEQDCKNCSHQNDCEKVYSQLCNSSGPSVFRGVVEVLLVPMVLFVGTIVLVEGLLSEKIVSQGLCVLIMIATAVIILSGYIALLKMWRYKN